MKREEIAIDFREAAEHFDSISTVYKCTAAIPIKKKFLESAAQVENMRCETCAKEYLEQVNINGPFRMWCPWRGCGGCFNHDPKGE